MVILAVTFGVFALLRPLIPPPEPTTLETQPGAFVRRSAVQAVQWQTLDDQPFATARRENRPLLLVMGTGSSETGRSFDQWVFADREVADRLNTFFVCVRIDLDEDPQWGTALWPRLRGQLSDQSFQIWALDAEGRPRATLTDFIVGDRFDPVSLMLMFGRWRDVAVSEPGTNEVWEIQQEERALMTTDTRTAPDLVAMTDAIVRELNTEEGGRPLRSLQRPVVATWRLLIEQGRQAEALAALTPVMEGGLTDWVDGGVFEEAERVDFGRLEWNKRAVRSAEWVALLALVSARTEDPYWRWAARWQFDRVMAEFVDSGGVAAYTVIQRNALGRSMRWGLGPRSFEDEAILGRSFELDVVRNGSLLPRVRAGVWTQGAEAVERGLEEIRRRSDPNTVTYGPRGLMDVTGGFAARMLEAARLMDDAERMQTARGLTGQFDAFRSGPADLIHSLEGVPDRSLFDYAAYVDAVAEAASSGSDPGLVRDGIRVLNRALEVFGTRGWLGVEFQARGVPEWIRADVPDAVDGLREASLATLARGALRLSLVMPEAEGASLRSRVGIWLTQAGSGLQGTRNWESFLRAWGMDARGVGVLVVGPNCEAEVRRVEVAEPGVAVLGVRSWPDIEAGVYVIGAGGRTGPMGGDEALRRLGRFGQGVPE